MYATAAPQVAEKPAPQPSVAQAARGPVQHFRTKVTDNVCVITFDTPGAKVISCV